MVGSDVEYHGYIGPELVHVLQLEARQFYHIYVVLVAGHLQREALPHVPGETHVDTGVF